jgi:type VI secretion system secreted protein VgrG
MVDEKVDPKNYPIRIEGTYADETLFLIAATVEEGMSSLTRTEIEFVSTNRSLELRKLVGSKIKVTMDAPGGRKRVFPGTCVSVEYLGAPTGPGHYRAELRPWLWFLTRKRDSRIFQQMSVPTIVQTILGEFGFSGDVESSLNEIHNIREYIVQYRETALDFLNRLMEEEGMFFFFIESGGKEKLVLADSVSGYKTVAGSPKIPFRAIAVGDRRNIEHIFDLRSSEKVTSGKVTLNDYDFEHPQADLFSATASPKGSHEGKDHEIYDYPGRYRET